MIHNTIWLHQKLPSNKCLRIILTRENFEVRVDDTDNLKEDMGDLLIHRKNGNTVIINPNEIVMVCTMKKGVYL